MQDVVPIFHNSTVENPSKSKEAGRPVHDDVEMVEIRIPGDTQRIVWHPVNEIWKYEDGVPITYADRFPQQYARFKAQQPQAVDGTPLSELPFLTEAQRKNFRALNVHTAEALAELDGPHLKSLGQGGREAKNRAQAYLDNASGSANTTAMAKEIEDLKNLVKNLIASGVVQQEPVGEEPDAYGTWSDEDLKERYEQLHGARPRGNPSRATLVRLVQELENAGAQAAE